MLLGQAPEHSGGHEPGVVGSQRPPHELLVAVGDAVARDLAHDVVHERQELEQVPVGVDHRMVEAGADARHVVGRHEGERHGRTPQVPASVSITGANASRSGVGKPASSWR